MTRLDKDFTNLQQIANLFSVGRYLALVGKTMVDTGLSLEEILELKVDADNAEERVAREHIKRLLKRIQRTLFDSEEESEESNH